MELKNTTRRRRILIVSQWFDPEPTFKGLMFAKALQKRGFDVQVLTGFPNYPGGKLYDGYRLRFCQREVLDGVDVLRVPIYPSHDASALRRVLNYVSFAASASVAALFVRRPDVAYVYHPPATVGIVAQILKLSRGVPFVYDVQDLWPDTLGATGMLNSNRVLGAVGSFMRSVYGSATRVAALSPGFGRTLSKRGVPTEKIDVIPNWTYEPPRSKPIIDAGAASSDEFVVLYAGNVGAAQALEVVKEAAVLLENEPVRFDIIGDGLALDDLRAAVEDEGLENVQFLPRRPAFEMDAVFDSADALLVHLRDDPLFSITIPSKTQAYLRAGRPILMGVRGDAADLVKQAGAGVAFTPESAESLAHAVRTLMARTADERAAMGQAGRCHYEEQLSLEVGADRFAEVLSEASYMRPRFLGAKRALDIVVSAVGLVVCAVPLLVLAGLVHRDVGSPIFFVHERPGRDGVPFKMVKFRTMRNARGTDGELMSDGARLTEFGRRLRATSLDELPELWNVLKGNMSIVGPRPLLPRYTPFFRGRERLRLRVRPGITGWAQINGRNTSSWDARLSDDAWYVENQSLALDFRIVLATVRRVFRSDGVVVDPESIMMNLDDERARASAL